jgi:hypothetical protein
VEFPLDGLFPEVEWEEAGIEGEGTLKEIEDIGKVAAFAWSVYGTLAVAHWTYYSDRYYYFYTMGAKHWWATAGSTWYGFAWWVRNFTKAFSWLVVGLFWVLSMIPTKTTFWLFACATTYSMMIEGFVIFFDAFLLFVSFFSFSDAYDNQHHLEAEIWSKLGYMIGIEAEWEHERDEAEDYAFTDLELQIFSLTT